MHVPLKCRMSTCSSHLPIRQRVQIKTHAVLDDGDEACAERCESEADCSGGHGEQLSPVSRVRKAAPVPCTSAYHPDSRGTAVNRFVAAAAASASACSSDISTKLPPPDENVTNVWCSKGHVMHGKVAREIKNYVVPDHATDCDTCCLPINASSGAWYRCKVCRTDRCISCSHAESRTGVSSDLVREVMPGDILLLGPDAWSIHHTVLVRSCMEPVADPDFLALLEGPPEAETYECHTIESTGSGHGGDVTSWYPSVSFFQRVQGTLYLVADLPLGSSAVDLLETPAAVKVLMHPLRDDRLDRHLFNEAVVRGAAEARRYGKKSAVKAFVAQILQGGDPVVLDLQEFPTPESRATLLEELRRRWDTKPICTALCVKVWQMYFELLGREVNELDQAVKEILQWMPVYSNRITPSALVKALTKRGWKLHHL